MINKKNYSTSINDIFNVIDKYKHESILLVTGKKSYESSGAKKVIDKLIFKKNYIHFDDFSVNPKLDEAILGAKHASEKKIDLIISVGGGSVLDMSKIIKALIDQYDNAYRIASGVDKFADNGIPIIAIPTTAGSGSEATHFAVVYIDGIKHSLANQCLLPNEVILDGSLCASATKYQKACNVLDAMSQAIESAWAVNATNESLKNSFKAVKECLKHFKSYVNETSDQLSCQGMIEASNLSGHAINVAKTTSAHAWSYGLSTNFNVAHGHAVWATLPSIYKIHLSNVPDERINDKRGKKHIENVMNQLNKILKINSNDDVENFFKEMLQEINISSDLVDYFKISYDDRKALSESVNKERMANNPISFNENEVNQIFKLN